MVGCKIYTKEKADWLRTLLRSKFFDSCVQHRDARKNEKNVFCIDCSMGYCRHCAKAHRLHRCLQICKYVYHDVVRLQDMQKYLDCSRIQTYKINGEKAVHLNPRPQAKDAKPSTKAKFGASCEACGRYLQDVPNRFCSIACKFLGAAVMVEKQSGKKMKFTVQQIHCHSCKENQNQEEQLSDENESSLVSHIDMSDENENQLWVRSFFKPKKQVHKRKGIPRRAPMC